MRTTFYQRLDKVLLEADDLTNIARKLADEGEDTINRREALRRGAGAVAAGSLGSTSGAATAAKPLFDILKSSPDLWRDLIVALAAQPDSGALLGTVPQLKRRGLSLDSSLQKSSVG